MELFVVKLNQKGAHPDRPHCQRRRRHQPLFACDPKMWPATDMQPASERRARGLRAGSMVDWQLRYHVVYCLSTAASSNPASTGVYVHWEKVATVPRTLQHTEQMGRGWPWMACASSCCSRRTACVLIERLRLIDPPPSPHRNATLARQTFSKRPGSAKRIPTTPMGCLLGGTHTHAHTHPRQQSPFGSMRPSQAPTSRWPVTGTRTKTRDRAQRGRKKINPEQS